tara:strand:- start:184 stop:363 length:180 start_codon:yes stop_codon:yes gene_type:complete
MTAGNSNVSKYKKTYNVAWSPPPPKKKKETLWNDMKNIKKTIKEKREEERKRIQEMLGN